MRWTSYKHATDILGVKSSCQNLIIDNYIGGIVGYTEKIIEYCTGI